MDGAKARTTADGVELDADGAVERIRHASIDALTSVHDKTGAVTELRLERRDGCPLVFEIQGTTPEQIARALGVDATRARQRFALLSRAVPRGSSLVLLGLGLIAWTRFGGQPVTEETAEYIRSR